METGRRRWLPSGVLIWWYYKSVSPSRIGIERLALPTLHLVEMRRAVASRITRGRCYIPTVTLTISLCGMIGNGVWGVPKRNNKV
jgi:hypothetical protein